MVAMYDWEIVCNSRVQIKVKMQLPVSSRPVTGSEDDQQESNTK